MTETFEDIRFKDLDELTDDDKKVLRDHKDDLTEEEMETFGKALEEPGKGKELTFKTQEEVDTYLDNKFEEKMAALSKKEPKKTPEKKELVKDELRFFDDKYTPANWNQALVESYPKLKERLSKEIREELRMEKEEFNKELDRINKAFDEEIEGLKKSGEPIPEKGTAERKAFDKELAQIGIKFTGVTNMTQSYEIYKATHSKTVKKEGDENEENEENTQIKTAKRIGSGGGSSDQTQPRKYRVTATSTMDDARERALKKFKQMT